MQARHKIIRCAEAIESGLAHTRHDAHAGDDVGRIGDFDADFAVRRFFRSENVGDHVHGPALHCAIEQGADFIFSLLRRHPIIGRTGGVFGARADEGEVLRASDVVWIAAVKITARMGGFVQLDVGAVAEHFLDEAIVFRLGSIAPDYFCGFRQARAFINPLLDWGSHRTSKNFNAGSVARLAGRRSNELPVELTTRTYKTYKRFFRYPKSLG